jgi:mannitol/fructose-specific phosphotransferase system IIA component (Ntr-type)
VSLNLKESIPASRILAPLRAETDDEALSRLVAAVADDLEIPDAAGVLDRLLHEPVLRAALVGHGAAIIHSRIDGLPRSVAALGVAPPGTSFRFGGGFRYVVSVIFLVLSPPEPPEPHLELVSAIASFVRDSQALDGLKAAASPEQAVRALGAT